VEALHGRRAAVIQPAVACITSPRLGTAFAIDCHAALTAWHCVRDPADDSKVVETVDLHFLGDELVSAQVGPGDPSQDWVILRLTTPLPVSLRPIPLLREVEPGEPCRCLGFPVAAAELGYVPVLATVSGQARRAGVPMLTLEAPALAAGLDARLPFRS
jgi:hypothetical protein